MDANDNAPPTSDAAGSPLDQPAQSPDSPGSIRSVIERVRQNRYLWQGKIGPAFWTLTGVMSLTVNIILIIILVILTRELFALKGLVGDQLLGGLEANFQAMDAAVIETTVIVESTIQVQDTIPVVFDLILEQDTMVVLTEDTSITGAIVNIDTPTLKVLNANTDITLPAGSELPTALNIVVPVSQTVPVNLTVPVYLEVPVTIPLEDTELHDPFVGLQGVVSPYNSLLADTPNSWGEAACEAGRLLCWLFRGGEK